MVKTAIILAFTLLLIYAGLDFLAKDIDTPRSEIFSWTGIIFGLFLLERGLQYVLKLPFKKYFQDVRKHRLARIVQDTGITLSYLSFWLAVGFTPISGLVKGENTDLTFSNPIFLKIALVLIIATLLFSLLWWVTVQFKK